MTDEEVEAIEAGCNATLRLWPKHVDTHRMLALVAEVRRWKLCAANLSRHYEGCEPRPEEWLTP